MTAQWSIGTRLTFWYSLILLASLVLFGSGIWLVVSHSLRASLQDTLDEHAKGVITVLRSVNPKKPWHVREELTEYASATPGGNLMEVRDSEGQQIVASKTVALEAEDPSSAFGVQVRPSGRYRTFTTTASANGRQYRVLVATPMDATEATLRRVRMLLLWSTPLVLLLASLGGYWISRRALAPVDEITRAARLIGIQSLSQRLIVPATGDEIQRPAETWNEMLVRLEAGHRAQQRFLSDASHELRSPLSTIISGLEVTEAHPELLDAELAVDTLLPEAHRMRVLIEDLLLLARADEQSSVMRKEEVALDELAEVEAARVRREAGCTIHTDICPTRLTGDPAAMSRMIRNLVDNAVRHANSLIVIEVSSRDGTAILSISDDGPGIAPAERTRVFERFVRLDSDRSRSGGGAGLGLAIVAEVVAAHGGTVTVDDRPGGGTKVIVALPRNANRIASSAETS